MDCRASTIANIMVSCSLYSFLSEYPNVLDTSYILAVGGQCS